MCLVALGVLLAVWLLVCVRYIVHPVVDKVEHVDALYVLGPSWERMPRALELADSGVTDVIVSTTTINWDGDVAPEEYCDRAGEVRVICVVPEPYTTQGEMRMLSEMAREKGWHRVAVMTMTAHVSRARLWADRCVGVPVDVWEFQQPETPLGWAYQFLYQTGGWVKAQVLRNC